MKKFTKLVLATSVAFSANVMAMQAMDDASLSETTGKTVLVLVSVFQKLKLKSYLFMIQMVILRQQLQQVQ